MNKLIITADDLDDDGFYKEMNLAHEGDVIIQCDIKIRGYCDIGGNFNIGVDCDISGNCDIGGNFNIRGNCNISGNCNIGVDCNIRGYCYIVGNCDIEGYCYVRGNCNIGGRLQYMSGVRSMEKDVDRLGEEVAELKKRVKFEQGANNKLDELWKRHLGAVEKENKEPKKRVVINKQVADEVNRLRAENEELKKIMKDLRENAFLPCKQAREIDAILNEEKQDDE